jgi:hypothetical protein
VVKEGVDEAQNEEVQSDEAKNKLIYMEVNEDDAVVLNEGAKNKLIYLEENEDEGVVPNEGVKNKLIYQEEKEDDVVVPNERVKKVNNLVKKKVLTKDLKKLLIY